MILAASARDSMSKSQTADIFDVSLSSVKRYLRIAGRGESLVSRGGGGRPWASLGKTDTLKLRTMSPRK